tara:strand:+ start:207 stop:536 length:330 start_codon:yes stop_codon:yes gene_type:complete
MSGNAEEGIARTQAAAIKASGTQGKELEQHQQRSIAYLDERILTTVLVLALIGLVIVWSSTSSKLVLYGSLVGVLLMTVIWGVARVKRIERLRQQRIEQAASWRSDQVK